MAKAQPEKNLPLHLPMSELEKKPTWRGWIHTGALPVVVAGGVLAIVFAHGWVAKLAASIFLTCSVLLFGMSALYHRFNWSPSVKIALKRIDHANIFLLIAGSYTPITLLALPEAKGIVLISVIWASALIGIGFRVFWITAPRWLYVPIYIAMGWIAIAFMNDFMNANSTMMILILVGGLCYTVGAIAYALKRPNPFPGKFGFHEIFHAFTVAAFLCHWTAVFLICLAPASGSLGG